MIALRLSSGLGILPVWRIGDAKNEANARALSHLCDEDDQMIYRQIFLSRTADPAINDFVANIGATS